MQIQIWSDVVCPWCYIGKRKFEAALAAYERRDELQLSFKPYQLDPTAPPGVAMPVREAYARKFGGDDQADVMIARVTQAAAEVGIEFRMDRAVRANTRDAHRLIAFAGAAGGWAMQSVVKEALMRAYFCDGGNVGDHETLLDVAVACGLEGGAVATMLDSNDRIEALNADLAYAREQGITAVPTFVIDERWSVPGAQEPETFLRVFERLSRQ